VNDEISKNEEANPRTNLIKNERKLRSFSRTDLIKTKISTLKDREEPVSKFQ
jgi:hypothetical protein